jgi:hypothetical protein
MQIVVAFTRDRFSTLSRCQTAVPGDDWPLMDRRACRFVTHLVTMPSLQQSDH